MTIIFFKHFIYLKVRFDVSLILLALSRNLSKIKIKFKRIKINIIICDQFYIGKTSRCLIRRIEEHKKGVGSIEYKSAVYKHEADSGHKIEYDNIEVLDNANNDKKLLLKEMLYINKLKPSLNKQRKSALFSLIIGNS